MDEVKFQQWSQIREHGLLFYFIRRVLLYCVIGALVFIVLNLITKLYSFKQISNQIEIMSIAITFAQLLRWFINEKSYKAYQSSFHKN